MVDRTPGPSIPSGSPARSELDDRAGITRLGGSSRVAVLSFRDEDACVERYPGQLLNAAGRRGRLTSVRAALGQALRDIVTDFRLEHDVAQVLERFMFPPGEEASSPRHDHAVVDLLRCMAMFDEKGPIIKPEPGQVYAPVEYHGLPFWAPHAGSGHVREAMSGRKFTMNKPRLRKAVEDGA